MNIVNETQDRVLAEDIIVPKSFREKATGLLNEKNPKGLYVKTRWGIHTAGMNFPIDVIIADKNMKVRKIVEKVNPGNFVFWNPRFNNVFELPSGTVEKTDTKVFNKIKLEK